MQKPLKWVKDNKKILIIAILLTVLICIVCFMNMAKGVQTGGTAYSQDKSATEIKLCGILSNMEGVGETDVMINESNGEITGVVIICRGADNIMTRSNILNAVSTALNIDKKIIAIYSMN